MKDLQHLLNQLITILRSSYLDSHQTYLKPQSLADQVYCLFDNKEGTRYIVLDSFSYVIPIE